MKPGQLLKIEGGAASSSGEVARIGVALIFIVMVMVFTGAKFRGFDEAYLLIAATVIGAYMAMNIGANDVANNVGPAVGSLALTMVGAIAIAAVFEAGGAIIAGGDVIKTVKNGIIDPGRIDDKDVFIWVMLGALLGAAVWLNVATALGAPVSTTHSIVGGVMGAGIAARGWDVVNWGSMATIASSWVISPLVGGLFAAVFLYLVKRMVFFRDDMIESAKRVVPLLIAIMAWAFATYLLLKGFKAIVKVAPGNAIAIGAIVAVLTYAIVRPLIARAAPGLSPDRDGVNRLFTLPLICAAALLSFAHGANDVANAVGPLAGVVDILTGQGEATSKVAIPTWVMVIGALGISVGLALFGPKLIRTVGSEITELDRARAFCISLAAAVTVIVASQLGLPISSTHVAIGAVFGVGFLREFLEKRLDRVVDRVLADHAGDANLGEVESFLRGFRNAPLEDRQRMLKEVKSMGALGVIQAGERKRLRKAVRRQLVERRAILKIVSAWLITVPLSGVLSALFFFLLRGMLLPD